jgi:putative tryptophan/tyrosine transport system substrate-binding protein
MMKLKQIAAARHAKTRRDIIRGLVGVGLSASAMSTLSACSALASFGQRSNRTPEVAYIYLYRAGPSRPFVNDFRQALHDLGWFEGQTIGVEIWDAEGSADRLSTILTDLIGRKVDVIVTACTPEAKAAEKITDATPIVVAAAGDLVKAGLAASLAHPGGNVTGVTGMMLDLSAKRIELLKEAFPKIATAAVLWNPERPDNAPELEAMQVEARRQGVQLDSLQVHTPAEIDAAFDMLTHQSVDALLNLGDGLLSSQAARIVNFAAQRRIPAMYENREYPEAGGLMSYGPNFPSLHRRAAGYVDRILKGARPADLPVERPDRFELVVNGATSRTLDLPIPRSVLVLADSVIQ